MTNPETIQCENCRNHYLIHEPLCPHCEHPNPYWEDETEENDEEMAAALKTRPWWRSPLGCISLVLFFAFIAGGAALGFYQGLGERSTRKQLQVQEHYQQALANLENQQVDLAMAELNQTLTLDPTHAEARELLRKLKAAQVETPTATSESRQNLAADLYTQAKALTLQGNWEGAIELLTKIRDVDAGFEPLTISNNLYSAYYELGLRFVAEKKLNEALQAFDKALEEHPNDPAVTVEWEKASLYQSLPASDVVDFEDHLVILNKLYALDPEFFDVKTRLYNTYKNYGDSLASQNEWCQAKPRYQSAQQLSPNADMEALVADAELRCTETDQTTAAPLPAVAATVTTGAEITATATLTGSTVAAAPAQPTVPFAGGNGTLYFARFNTASQLWEIMAFSLANGTETPILSDGTQPAVDSNSSALVYHSERSDSLGLHTYSLTTGEDLRSTTFPEDILPKWGAGNQQFVFASQRAGDRRWQIFTSFTDGKGDAVIVADGRTPDLSPAGNIIAYQGADPQGNNPGIYTIPAGGGEARPITTNESDRSPVISPDGSTIAYMSTQSGNWDIWLAPVAGGSATSLVASPANDGLPVWSPDGSQLAFVSDRDGSWGIYIVSAQGGAVQKVTGWGTMHPDWLLEQISWGR